MTDHQNSSAGSDDGPDTPDEALDLLMHEAGWIDMHGGDHHEDDCPVCRSIAMVRAGLNHAYPPSHAGGTFTDAQPSVEAMKAAVELEIHATLGRVQTVEIGRMIQKAIDASQPSPVATVEPSAWHCPACEAAVIVDDPTPAHLLCSAASDDLIERLRNPMWAHSTAPFPSPQLEQEENLAAMNEAAAEIERLRAVPQSFPVQLTGEIACILEDCSPPEKQTPEALTALIEGYQPIWDRIRSALSRPEGKP